MTRLRNEERETILLTDEATDMYEIYTFNSRLISKLKKFSDKHPDLCTLIRSEGGSVTYMIKKDRVSINFKSPLSEERREQMRQSAIKRGFGK